MKIDNPTVDDNQTGINECSETHIYIYISEICAPERERQGPRRRCKFNGSKIRLRLAAASSRNCYQAALVPRNTAVNFYNARGAE